jgi:hypothetical protein
VQADPRPQARERPGQGAVETLELGFHVERGGHGAVRIVLVSNGQREDGHDRVPDELVDHAAEAFDAARHVPEIPVEDGDEDLGLQPLAEAREAPDVTEEDRDFLLTTPVTRLTRLAEEEVDLPVADEAPRAVEHPRTLAQGLEPGVESAADLLRRRGVELPQRPSQEPRRLLPPTVGLARFGPGLEELRSLDRRHARCLGVGLLGSREPLEREGQVPATARHVGAQLVREGVQLGPQPVREVGKEGARLLLPSRGLFEIAGAKGEASEVDGGEGEPDAVGILLGQGVARVEQTAGLCVLTEGGATAADLREELGAESGHLRRRRLDVAEVALQMGRRRPEVAELHAEPPQIAQRQRGTGLVTDVLLAGQGPFELLARIRQQPLVVEELTERVEDPAGVGTRPQVVFVRQERDASIQRPRAPGHVPVEAPGGEAAEMPQHALGVGTACLPFDRAKEGRQRLPEEQRILRRGDRGAQQEGPGVGCFSLERGGETRGRRGVEPRCPKSRLLSLRHGA